MSTSKRCCPIENFLWPRGKAERLEIREIFLDDTEVVIFNHSFFRLFALYLRVFIIYMVKKEIFITRQILFLRGLIKYLTHNHPHITTILKSLCIFQNEQKIYL